MKSLAVSALPFWRLSLGQPELFAGQQMPSDLCTDAQLPEAQHCDRVRRAASLLNFEKAVLCRSL